MKTKYFITLDYLFGSGTIYSKFYKDTPYDIYKNLPSDSNFDISSKDADQESQDILFMDCKCCLNYKLNRLTI